MSNDNDEVAILAALTGQGLKNMFQPPGTPREDLAGIAPTKLVDWRRFANNQVNPQQYQPQQVIPIGHGLPQDGNQVQSQPLLPVPVGVNPDGSIIMGNPLQALQQPVNTPQFQPQYEQPLQTTGFQLPSFGKPPEKSAVDEDQFEKLVKELKSVKSLVNKLIRQVAEIKVIIQPQQEKEIENTDQS
jgi:hypothetical protein